MNINDLGFLLTKIDEMAFTNPFGGRRDQLEAEILGKVRSRKLGKRRESTFHPRLQSGSSVDQDW